jgi:hypothetical protein
MLAVREEEPLRELLSAMCNVTTKRSQYDQSPRAHLYTADTRELPHVKLGT